MPALSLAVAALLAATHFARDHHYFIELMRDSRVDTVPMSWWHWSFKHVFPAEAGDCVLSGLLSIMGHTWMSHDIENLDLYFTRLMLCHNQSKSNVKVWSLNIIQWWLLRTLTWTLGTSISPTQDIIRRFALKIVTPWYATMIDDWWLMINVARPSHTEWWWVTTARSLLILNILISLQSTIRETGTRWQDPGNYDHSSSMSWDSHLCCQVQSEWLEWSEQWSPDTQQPQL